MKKKFFAAVFATIFLSAGVGGVLASQKNESVPVLAENWQIGEMDNKQLFGTTFTVPSAKVELGGTLVDATATVRYPDGTTTAESVIQLSQSGNYVVTYRATHGGKHYIEEKPFTVDSKAYFVQDETSSISYGLYDKLGANSEGLQVRLAYKDTLQFSKLIDVDELSASTNIIEGFVTPDLRGNADFNRLIVTLTDSLDSSVSLRFEIKRYTINPDRGKARSYVSVGGNGQDQVGREGSTYYYNDESRGTPISHSFVALTVTNVWDGDDVDWAPDKGKFSVALDPKTLEVTAGGSQHVADLDDLNIYDTAWTGFPSGKAKLTVSAENYSSETANFVITSVAGMDDLSNEDFIEAEAPIITVEAEESAMPQGQIGYSYAIPKATAIDFYSGKCDVSIGVWRNYASDKPISVSVVDGGFCPTVAGWHTIVYTSKDSTGNVARELRNVYIAKKLEDIIVTLPDNVITEITLGSWVQIKNAICQGGSGTPTCVITATNGETTFVIEDGFIPEIAGEWTIVYTYTDYIGRTGKASYTLNAVPGNEYVLLDELVLPQIFLSDVEYILPEIYANDYASGTLERNLTDVYVTDANGTNVYTAGNSFIPVVDNNGDIVTLSYQYNGSILAEVGVPCVLVKGNEDVGDIIAKNYVYGTNVTVSDNYRSGIGIKANEKCERCGWTFATPQLTNDLGITFQAIAEKANYEALVITLTDAKNPSVSISVSLRVAAIGSVITVGDSSVTTNGVSLISEEQFTVQYANGKFTFDGVSLRVEKTLAGEDFTGFPSNLAYIHVDMVNADIDAEYMLLAVSGSNLSWRNYERYAPSFTILGDFAGNQSINTIFEVFPAIAADVFAPQTNLWLTVIAPDGTIVRDINGTPLDKVSTDVSYFIQLSQYGYYMIKYYAEEKDWVVSNPLEITEPIYVIDEVAPQAKFITETKTTAKIGDTLVLPKFVYQDNCTATENIMVVKSVITPIGKVLLLEGDTNAIVCAYAGEYRFVVMISDEFGNMTTLRYVITVSA